MAQEQINPFENNRLQNAKARRMLAELGLSPTPDFRKGLRPAALAMDRVLGTTLIRSARGSRLFFNALNGELASAYALPNGDEPLIFLDFKNGIYEIDGAASTVGALLTENPDWGSWNAGTMISPGVGISAVSASPVLSGEAFTRVAAGATMLLTFRGVAGNGSQALRFEMVDSLIGYNTYYYSQHAFAGALVSWIGDQVNPDVTEADLADGLHKTALTMLNGKISRSTDGAVIITINPAAAWTPAPTVLGFVVTASVVLESIGIYPAQVDGTLPALSAL